MLEVIAYQLASFMCNVFLACKYRGNGLLAAVCVHVIFLILLNSTVIVTDVVLINNNFTG